MWNRKMEVSGAQHPQKRSKGVQQGSLVSTLVTKWHLEL